jgi:23S rRNA (adenine2503-C2)-methyltransferase
MDGSGNTPMSQTPILKLDASELADWCAAQGEPAYRARQVLRWIYQRRAQSFEQMTDLPRQFRAALADRFAILSSTVETVRATADDTRKLLVRLTDGQAVECVLMAEAERRTVCVSTQVGCGMGCVFCASGLDGVLRNLEAYEIVEQFLHARNLLGVDEHLTHAVIMGMGEPLANLDNLLAALDVVCSPDGLKLSQRHVTISTVGLPPRIRQLADAGRGYHLAVSLHAPDDELRNRLVPPSAKIGIGAVLEAADYFATRTGRQVTYEYVLLRDVNDSSEQARALARRLATRQVHVNLIPYNPVAGLPYATPRSESVHEFAETLRRAGLSVKVRKTKGRKIDAACGQLRLTSKPAVQAEKTPAGTTALDWISFSPDEPRTQRVNENV